MREILITNNFFHDEPDKTNIIDDDDDILNTDELQNSDDLVIEDSFPEDKISYSSCSVICDNLYHDIKNNNQISNYVIGLLLEIRHVIIMRRIKVLLCHDYLNKRIITKMSFQT